MLPISPSPTPGLISFAYGLPDPDLFPVASIMAATSSVLDRFSNRALQYGSFQGLTELILAVTERLKRVEDVSLLPEQCLVTTGSTQGNDLIMRALLKPGDTVLLETPTWPAIIGILKSHSANVVPIPIDSYGLNVTALESTILTLISKGILPKLLYTIPTFHNPTGITMSLPRRLALLDIARRYDFTVVEDDAYRDISFGGPVPQTLLALDKDDRVIRLGTFSKIVAPGLRLGWLLGKSDIVAKITTIRNDSGTSPFVSYIATVYMMSGKFDEHIAQVVEAYRSKALMMLQSISSNFPLSVSWTQPSGGFFVWVTLPAHQEMSSLLKMARERGVEFLPGQVCCPESVTDTSHVRLAFSMVNLNEIEEGIERLSEVLKETL
jgi:2-aminoadipate transaminase